MAKTNKVSFVPETNLCSFIGIDVNLGDWSKVRLGRQLFLLSPLLCALFIAQLLQLNVQIVFLICTFVFLRQRPNYLPVEMTLYLNKSLPKSYHCVCFKSTVSSLQFATLLAKKARSNFAVGKRTSYAHTVHVTNVKCNMKK